MRDIIVSAGRITAMLAGTALLALCATGAARADVAGQLQCNVAGGEGSLITSTRNVSCTFQSNAGPVQLYNGTISRLGLDIGPLATKVLTYQVLALGTAAPGDLQGNYIGSGAGITLGTGIGVDALVGGSGNTITLQPLATSVSSGTNINAGLGALQLRFAGLAVPPPFRRHYRHHHYYHHRHHHHMG